jgi:hypothetical protein
VKKTYYKQLLHHWLQKLFLYPLYRHFYQDKNRDIGRCIILAGTARSGTTWVADIISSQVHARVMFEPFHARMVPEFSQYNYFQYLRPEVHDKKLIAYCLRVFTGDIRNKWIDRQVSTLYPQYRVIKEIRANLFLKWLHSNFSQIPIFFLIRHPCAVVYSRMQLNWATDGDVIHFLSQDKLVEDFLSDKLDLIRNAKSPEQKHAIIWSISNLVPLTQFKDEELNVIFYENLCLQPEVEIPRIFKEIGTNYKKTVFTSLNKPSATTKHDSAVMHGKDRTTQWKTKLSSRQINDILSVADAFDLSYLYGDSLYPITNKP